MRVFRTSSLVAFVAAALHGIFPLVAAGAEAADRASVVAVVGAAGEEEFGREFAESARRWELTCRAAGARFTLIGLETNSAGSDRDRLRQALEQETKEGAAEIWLVLLGHGTFDGKEARFNLRGPDFSATELAAWLDPLRRPLAVVNATSASAPFLAKLSRTNRIVITGTRSGHEVNYARFGRYLSESIADPAADLDKDSQTSLLEAFLTASRRTAEFYSTEGRLATEHALLDDTGDGLGTPAEWFRGVRAVKRARDGALLDGMRAHQFHLVRGTNDMALSVTARARRDDLELSIARLRDFKASMGEEEYYRKLESLLVEMAKLYESSGKPLAAPR